MEARRSWSRTIPDQKLVETEWRLLIPDHEARKREFALGLIRIENSEEVMVMEVMVMEVMYLDFIVNARETKHACTTIIPRYLVDDVCGVEHVANRLRTGG